MLCSARYIAPEAAEIKKGAVIAPDTTAVSSYHARITRVAVRGRVEEVGVMLPGKPLRVSVGGHKPRPRGLPHVTSLPTYWLYRKIWVS